MSEEESGGAAGPVIPKDEYNGPIEDEGSIPATGLEDWGYWTSWAQGLPPKGAGEEKPFRRGVIWR